MFGVGRDVCHCRAGVDYWHFYDSRLTTGDSLVALVRCVRRQVSYVLQCCMFQVPSTYTCQPWLE